MKNFIPIIFISLFFLVQYSCEEEEQTPNEEEMLIDLTGEWIGEGYDCPWGVKHDERISIEHNLETGEVIAEKITGDDCVTAGHKTFEGIYDGESPRFDVNFVTGLPTNPNSSSAQSTIEVINSKLMKDVGVYGIVFTKDFDSELPDCPCNYDDPKIQQNKRDGVGHWEDCGDALQAFHYGAKYEVRWNPDEEGEPGQQCTYSADKILITEGIAAGSPDKVAPGTCGWGPINEFLANNACWSDHCEYDVIPWKEIPCIEYLNLWKANDGNCSFSNEVSGIKHMEKMIGEMNCHEATILIQHANESTPSLIDDELREYILGEGISLTDAQLIEKLKNWKDLNSCFLFPNEDICLVIDKAISNLQ